MPHAGARDEGVPCGGVIASRVGCLLVWVGEAGVRLYAAGQPGGARADHLLYQAKLALDDSAQTESREKNVLTAIQGGSSGTAQCGTVAWHRGSPGEKDV